MCWCSVLDLVGLWVFGLLFWYDLVGLVIAWVLCWVGVGFSCLLGLAALVCGLC